MFFLWYNPQQIRTTEAHASTWDFRLQQRGGWEKMILLLGPFLFALFLVYMAIKSLTENGDSKMKDLEQRMQDMEMAFLDLRLLGAYREEANLIRWAALMESDPQKRIILQSKLDSVNKDIDSLLKRMKNHKTI